VRPVEAGRLQGAWAFVLAAGKKVCRFELAAVDAIAGNAMEVKVDVDAVLPAEIDDAIDLSQRLVIDVTSSRWACPISNTTAAGAQN
jgi:hypothetical protein